MQNAGADEFYPMPAEPENDALIKRIEFAGASGSEMGFSPTPIARTQVREPKYALDELVTQQAQIIAEIDDYKLLTAATLAIIPLPLIFEPAISSANH